MTFLRRSIKPSSKLDFAMAPSIHNAPECIERLSFLIRTSPQNADYLWLRGQLWASLAENNLSEEEFHKCLADFAASLLLDPTPMTTQAPYFILPEQEWAFPAYRLLLEQCLITHDQWMKEMNRPEMMWIASPSILLARRIARAIENAEIQDESLVDALLPYATVEPVHSMCPFRRALATLGWRPVRAGFALVTQRDLDNPDRHTRPESAGEEEMWLGLIHDSGLSEKDTESLHGIWRAFDHSDVEFLLKEMKSTDRFRRAVSCYGLKIFGRRLSLDHYLPELDNSHRFGRLVAITVIAERIGEIGVEHNIDEILSGCECLLRSSARDRAKICRRVAVQHLVKLASKHGQLVGRRLSGDARQLLEECLCSQDAGIVLPAIRLANYLDHPITMSVDDVASISCSLTDRFGNTFTQWAFVIEKARFVLSQVPLSDATNVWRDFKTLFLRADHHFRLEGVEAAKYIVSKNPSQRDALRPILFRCSQVDDCKAVRTAANTLVSSLT